MRRNKNAFEKSKRLFWATLLVLAFAPYYRARAEHFSISLTIENADSKTESHADDDPPPVGLNPWPVFHARVGEALTWQFFMTNVKPHEPFEQMKVRYYLAPAVQSGRKDLSASETTPVFRGEFLLDFKYKGRVGLRQQFRVDRPGKYVLRVESVDSHSEHEHFSAIDVEVQ